MASEIIGGKPEDALPNSPATRPGSKLGEILIEQGAISAKDLALALSRQLNMPLVELGTYQISPEALKLVPEYVAKEYDLIPLSIEGNALRVAMANPNDLNVLDAVGTNAKMKIYPMIATAEDIRDAINRSYRSYGEVEKQFSALESLKATKTNSVDASIRNAPAVRALDLIVEDAIKSRASDIHIEPQENRLSVRYRIDGVLSEFVSLPMNAHAPIISRLKVLSSMDIGDRRPQDGQFSIKANGKEVDIRVATISTSCGEMGTLRILDKSFALRKLNEIGFLPDNLKQYEEMLKSPFGMILVSGPTGSGKTTTLYASINSLDRKGRNIITIEDPVEYRLEGINQIQVNPRAGLTFADGLRAVMRHDPNIILVGEIRDPDTAATAVQAANTGHLVLASVHANDSVGVMHRLIDLGVEPYLVASAMVGIIAQRMVRRVCPVCRREVSVTPAEEQAYFEEVGEARKSFVYGAGCNRCSNTGYLGRIAVFEILKVTEEIGRLLSGGANAAQLRAKALEAGMVTMKHDGMLKVKADITTPSEVLKNIFSLG